MLCSYSFDRPIRKHGLFFHRFCHENKVIGVLFGMNVATELMNVLVSESLSASLGRDNGAQKFGEARLWMKPFSNLMKITFPDCQICS